MRLTVVAVASLAFSACGSAADLDDSVAASEAPTNQGGSQANGAERPAPKYPQEVRTPQQLQSATSQANFETNQSSDSSAKTAEERPRASVETNAQNQPDGRTQFADPAPPKVNQLEAVDPPEAKPYDRVTFHAAPKPLSPDATTHDWTSFLGPTHNAVSTETHLLDRWPDGGPSVVWELEKGTSYSSPAIQDNYLVFPHRVGDQVLIECLHRQTGRLFWQNRFPTEFEDRYGYNNGPRASPVIDGQRVYVYSAEGKLFCLHLPTGRVYWQRDLAEEFEVPQDFFGTAQTPLIEGDLVIVNIGAPGGPSVVGLDKRTGRMQWGAGDKWGPSYASPVPAEIHGDRRVFVFAGGESRPPTGGLLSIDPSDGHIDFRFPWRSRSYESVNASCAVVIGNRVFISATYQTGSALLQVQDDFDFKTLWTTDELGTHWNTAVHQNGHLYAFDGRNEPDAGLVCLELETGEVVWREEPVWEETVDLNGTERTLSLSPFRGCLLQVDGRFLCLGELGHLLWLDLSPNGYNELDRTFLFFARETWALPVLSRGLLYISQNRRDFLNGAPPRLVCYDIRGE